MCCKSDICDGCHVKKTRSRYAMLTESAKGPCKGGHCLKTV